MFDPAAGTWEFPSGHLEDGEDAKAAAIREWQEETGLRLPPGEFVGSWSANGIYQGFVYEVEIEAAVPIFEGRGGVTNPDDPDGDQIEALAWWDPAQLPGNPAVRDELAVSMPQVMAALDIQTARAGDEGTCPCGIPAVFDACDGWQHADGSISHDDGQSVSDRMGSAVLLKAGDADPKAPRSAKAWPGWDRDRALAAYYSARLRRDLAAAVDTGRIARQSTPTLTKATTDDTVTVTTSQALADNGTLAIIHGTIADVLTDTYTEGYVLGARSAVASVQRGTVDWSGWTPGDVDAANLVLGHDGLGAGLQQLLDDSGVTITSIGQGRFDDMARAIALSLERGDSSDTLAADLADILDNGKWADMVATTEIARAVSAASMDTYRANGIAAADWLDAEDGRVCVICEDNAANGPYLLADFPSMPGHPRCRCAPGAVVEVGPAADLSALSEGE